MSKSAAVRLYAALFILLAWAVSPAEAQFRPRPMSEPATGEKYIVEASAGFWNPASDMSISSEALGIIGSTINFKSDLGLESGKFRDLRLVVRPAPKHKFRLEYIPVRMSKLDHILATDLIFNGQRYPIRAQLSSTFEWRTTRLSYEYDFVRRERWFVGFIADAKLTDVKAELTTPAIREFVHAQGPLPGIGGIGRVYVVPSIAVTAEFTRMPVPEQITDDVNGRYSNLDIHGTVNFTNNVGAQVGYRKFDVGYKFEDDSGTFKLNGLYFGIVARY